MKLLLDEIYSRQIAARLRERGHDVIAVTERAELEGRRDDELFALMPAEQRAIVTENWADYDRLMRRAADAGVTHYGVVFTSRRRLPRSRDTIGLFVEVLDDFLRRDPRTDALSNAAYWLPDRPL